MTPQSHLRYVEGRRIVLAGVAINICLTLIKVVGGLVGNSQALVADGFHSLSDLATDVVVFFGLRYSAKPRDSGHPYGHGKIETLATTFVGVLLILTGFLLGFEGIRSAADRPVHAPGILALVAALFSIVLKEGLYRYTLAFARRINSRSLVANAWHHRSDALSSIVALVGIGGARLGLPMLDPVAAVAVALMIMKVGFGVVLQASRELVEESLKDEETRRMIGVAMGVGGVRSVPELHSRHVGPTIVVDMSITVDGGLSVREGHRIAHEAEDALVNTIPEVDIVTVHVEPHPGDGASSRSAAGGRVAGRLSRGEDD